MSTDFATRVVTRQLCDLDVIDRSRHRVGVARMWFFFFKWKMYTSMLVSVSVHVCFIQHFCIGFIVTSFVCLFVCFDFDFEIIGLWLLQCLVLLSYRFISLRPDDCYSCHLYISIDNNHSSLTIS